MSQSHGFNLSFMDLTSVSWKYLSFMEIPQFHGNLYILRYLHGRMTGMSTRRAVYDQSDTVLATIRLKANNVSASKYASFSGPRICTYSGFILRSF